MISKRTGKPLPLWLLFIERNPVSEEEWDAMEEELAVDPPQIDGHLMDEEIGQSEQSGQLIALVEQIATRARGERNGTADAMDLTQAATTILNVVDDFACNAPETRQGQICGEFLARLTHALVSRKKALVTSKRNVAYCDKIKALFSKKELCFCGHDSTRLVLEALSHFSPVYPIALIAQHLNGYPLSEDEQLGLKYEKFFRGEALSKEEADAMFKEMIFPWIASRPEEKLKKNFPRLMEDVEARMLNPHYRIKTLPAALRGPCKSAWHTIVKRNNRSAETGVC